MLDKLFSREINRRTGAHAIQIYIDNNTKSRKRSRAIGAGALNATKVTTRQHQGSLFHRLDVRLPWLKLVLIPIIGIIVILDLTNVTISRLTDPLDGIKVAPMSRHPKITERNLERKMLVALTFDDGPSSATTPALLDILTQKDAPATFFMLGSMARANPDIVKRAAKERHEIGSHTMYHQNLVSLSASAVQADIAEANTVFNDIISHGPSYTRPPYGNINDIVASSVGTPMILWSVDTRDWQDKDVEAIVNTAMAQVHDGAIILMHDIYPSSVEATSALIDALRNADYELATVTELAAKKNVTLSPGQAYYDLRP